MKAAYQAPARYLRLALKIQATVDDIKSLAELDKMLCWEKPLNTGARRWSWKPKRINFGMKRLNRKMNGERVQLFLV